MPGEGKVGVAAGDPWDGAEDRQRKRQAEPRALSEAERAEPLQTLHCERFADTAPPSSTPPCSMRAPTWPASPSGHLLLGSAKKDLQPQQLPIPALPKDSNERCPSGAAASGP